MGKKIKVYELDFGDTNVISERISDIISWIEGDLQSMTDKDELSYTITTKLMTIKQIDDLPDWA